MYTEVRRCMAIDYAGDFGPESVQEPGGELKHMDSEEYESYRKELEDQKRMIRLGYQRIKEKVKSVRQDYLHTVNKGTRSGSGKVVQDNCDLLNDIWGGSPSTTSLSFGIDGNSPGTPGTSAGTSSDLEEEVSEEPCLADTSTTSSDAEATKGKLKINVSNIPKLVDNKRRHMEKSFSQAQRDQILMSTAKEDLLMKKDMLEAFQQSNKTLDDSITKMTACLTSIGEGIASGMRMLAMALTNQPATPSPAMCYAQQNYPPQFGSHGSFGASSPMAHDASYVNRDEFPPSQFHRIGSGQVNGCSSSCGTRATFAANQALYDNDSNINSYNY